jgi:amino acid transporter
MSRSLFRKKSIDKIIKDAEEGLAESHEPGGLHRILTVKDLTLMGIAAIVGAGIFSTIGTAAYNGGPGISLLFVITAVTCGFSALCYAEFASRVPISGSAYTYAYVSFGELIAWIIGWALILEYAIGNIVVAISWSGYFNNLLEVVGIKLPVWLTTDPSTAKAVFVEAQSAMQTGNPMTTSLQFAYDAWTQAPVIGGYHIFMNVPACVSVVLITWLTFLGIRESKRSTNAMVVFKLAVIVFVIILGFFSVNPHNWSPFMPNGFEGVLRGVSAVFYAYIGFDAISTTAEECKRPQHDLPRGMINSLVICTVLYILIALVLTGMVSYKELNVVDPLAEVFQKTGQGWIAYIISISAVIATTSVLLVFQLGQPRIWMSMSRDGLLPKAFSRIHHKYKTPSFSTIVTGLLVAIPTLFTPSSLMVDLTSIGTLFAFILVSGGVLMLPRLDSSVRTGFKLPYIDGRLIVPLLYLLFVYLFRQRLVEDFRNMGTDNLQEILFIVFIAEGAILSALTIARRYSLIPILGVLFCSYLLIEIPAKSWLWFLGWMAGGLCIYFFYGYRNSKLKVKS